MIDRWLCFGVEQFLDRGVVTLGDTRFELVLPAPKPARRIRWAINAMSPVCAMIGSSRYLSWAEAKLRMPFDGCASLV
jgi:hypothetical protein